MSSLYSSAAEKVKNKIREMDIELKEIQKLYFEKNLNFYSVFFM